MAATTAYAQQQPFVVVRSALPPCVEGAYRATANGPCVCRSETPNFDSAHNRCIEPCVSGASWNRSRNECVCNTETPTYDSATRRCVIQPAPTAQQTIATRPSIENTVSWLNSRTHMTTATPSNHDFFSREIVNLCGIRACGTIHGFYDGGDAFELRIARVEVSNCTVRIQSSDSPDIRPLVETHYAEGHYESTNVYRYTVRVQQWIDFSLGDILSVQSDTNNNLVRFVARNSLGSIHYHLGMSGERMNSRDRQENVSESSQVDRSSLVIFVYSEEMTPRVASAWRNLLSYCQSSSTSTPEPF